MNNLPLTYVSICERMSKNVDTLAYAGPIRCSVTGPLNWVTKQYFDNELEKKVAKREQFDFQLVI